MRLWFDEDLSPTLVQVANALGFAATCNRDRNLLGASDARLRERVQAEGFVLVTDNATDFGPMLARETIHPGLIVLPAAHGRRRQQELAEAVILFVARAAADLWGGFGGFLLTRTMMRAGHGFLNQTSVQFSAESLSSGTQALGRRAPATTDD